MLDSTDIQLLRRIQTEGRATQRSLAEETGIAPSTAMERLRRLEESGVIRGYSADLDPGAVGLPTAAFVTVTLAPHTSEQVHAFSAAVAAIPEVLEAWHLTGKSDFLLHVQLPAVSDLEALLTDRLASLPGVARMTTSLVLSETKPRSPLPLPNHE